MESDSSKFITSDIFSDFNYTSNNYDSRDNLDFSRLRLYKFIKISFIVLIANLIFAGILYYFFYTQISNAVTYNDYLYFSLVTTVSVGYGDMIPITSNAKTAVTLYLIFLYSFTLSFAL
jgi:hypothetical protein